MRLRVSRCRVSWDEVFDLAPRKVSQLLGRVRSLHPEVTPEWALDWHEPYMLLDLRVDALERAEIRIRNTEDHGEVEIVASVGAEEFRMSLGGEVPDMVAQAIEDEEHARGALVDWGEDGMPTDGQILADALEAFLDMPEETDSGESKRAGRSSITVVEPPERTP